MYVGVDVSKSTLDYCELSDDSKEVIYGELANAEDAIIEFLSSYDADTTCFMYEPTGTYSDKFVSIAHSAGYVIYRVDTRRSSEYSKVLGVLNKNDQTAALTLAKMGQNLELEPYRSPSEQEVHRKQLSKAVASLQKQIQMLSKQIHAQEQLHKPNEIVLESYHQAREALEEQAHKLQEELVKELDEQEAEEFCKYAKSVPGVGDKTAQSMLIHCYALKHFDNSRQLARYVGVVGTSHTSGSSVRRKGAITKSGPAQLRAILYCAAGVAKIHNPACKDLYLRLRANGKPYKVAMIAVVNKLLRQIFAVVKSKTEFDKNRYAIQKEKRASS